MAELVKVCSLCGIQFKFFCLLILMITDRKARPIYWKPCLGRRDIGWCKWYISYKEKKGIPDENITGQMNTLQSFANKTLSCKLVSGSLWWEYLGNKDLDVGVGSLPQILTSSLAFQVLIQRYKLLLINVHKVLNLQSISYNLLSLWFISLLKYYIAEISEAKMKEVKLYRQI
jgi:hypothetical protein